MKSKIEGEKYYIPYHVNPAIIKSFLRDLPKDQLILHGRYIRRRVLAEKPGTNKRTMFINLYRYCRSVYIKMYM